MEMKNVDHGAKLTIPGQVTFHFRMPKLAYHWKLTDFSDSGPSHADASANADPYYNPQFIASEPFGCAARFEQDHQNIRIQNIHLAHLGQPFAVAFWANPAGVQRAVFGDVCILGYTSESRPTSAFGFAVQQNGRNTNQYFFYFGTGKKWVNKADPVCFQLRPNVWQHVAISCDLAQIQVFVDAVLVCTAQTGGGIMMPYGTDFNIGFNNNVFKYFTGELADIRIYKGKLEQADVAQIMLDNNNALKVLQTNIQQLHVQENQLINKTVQSSGTQIIHIDEQILIQVERLNNRKLAISNKSKALSKIVSQEVMSKALNNFLKQIGAQVVAAMSKLKLIDQKQEFCSKIVLIRSIDSFQAVVLGIKRQQLRVNE